MNLPKLRIIWDDDDRKVPAEISVIRLTNGFLIGRTYCATEEEFVKELVARIKDPYAER